MLVDDAWPSVEFEGEKGTHRDDRRQAASTQLALSASESGLDVQSQRDRYDGFPRSTEVWTDRPGYRSWMVIAATVTYRRFDSLKPPAAVHGAQLLQTSSAASALSRPVMPVATNTGSA